MENSAVKKFHQSEKQTFFKFKQEANVQCILMKQASKALEMCEDMKKSAFDLKSYIEAERILLLASYKYDALVKEFQSTKTETSSQIDLTIEIANIKVARQSVGDEWFVCVVSQSSNVYSTKATQMKSNDTELNFNEKFIFCGLDLQFEIVINFYVLKSCAIQKYRNNKNKLMLSRSFRKLLHNDVHSQTLLESCVYISLFASCGTIKLNKTTTNKSLNLKNTSNAFSLGGLEVKLTHFKISAYKCGFLTLGCESDGGIVWSRKWCVLEGHRIKFWHYPQQESEKNPAKILQLEKCTQEIAEADRSRCPRPRCLAMIADGERTIYFNLDSVGELHDWKNKINQVYRILLVWKVTNVPFRII